MAVSSLMLRHQRATHVNIAGAPSKRKKVLNHLSKSNSMRPTDKEIEEEFYTMPLESARGEVEMQQWAEENAARLKQQEAAKWARDFDPWHYIEDGDLPKLESTKEDYIKETGEPLNISISSPVLISCGKGDFAKAYFLTYESLNGYKYECFEKHTNRLEFKPEDIKCWMYIPEPKR
ncbi:hypothetical protein OSG_eHP30_00070 [environmental Halophage eHP-30]|nr:hypothetical protein OSG_eHP30_00070 [environmental Halophage eHP-30]